MEFPGAAVFAHPSPVAQTERGVAVLLDLQQQIAAADGVKDPGGDVIGVARNRAVALEQLFDLDRVDHLLKLEPGGLRAQPGHDPGAPAGGDHVPHFGFGFGAVGELPAGLLVRVDLKTQPVAGINELDQQGETAGAGRLDPQQRAPVMADKLGKMNSGQGALFDFAVGAFTVGNFPRFAGLHALRRFPFEQFGEQRTAPRAFHVDGAEFQRRKSADFRKGGHSFSSRVKRRQISTNSGSSRAIRRSRSTEPRITYPSARRTPSRST